MSWLDFEGLAREAARFDAHVARTPDIDRFCTTADWILPAQAAFAPPDATPFAWGDDDGYVALMNIDFQGSERIAVPLEASWGLAAPFAGSEPDAVVESLRAMVAHAARPPGGLFLSGLRRHGPWMRAVLKHFAGFRIGTGPACARRVASLEGGVDGFLGRRSAKFRANLRRARRRAHEAGFEYEWHAGQVGPVAATRLFERIIDVERRSWKGREGHGIDEGSPRRFYDLMVHRLAGNGRLRVVFARREGVDRAYVFGGVFGGTYRGLQVSFVDDCAEWSLGNLAQLEMIERLCAEGVDFYDLGTDMPYKRRWAEPGLETVTLAVLSEYTASLIWR